MSYLGCVDESNMNLCVPPQEDGCVIAGICYAADSKKPGSECQVCTPAESTTEWTEGKWKDVSLHISDGEIKCALLYIILGDKLGKYVFLSAGKA